MKRKVVAMLLAGGQGSRLKSLTHEIAKPALPFGGKYRIIDFPLSNCVNSGIHTVGVLTQYQPHVLHNYIGLGTPWDLDRRSGGVTMLTPYAGMEGIKWYDGTADAIYQNIKYLTEQDPKYVIILSGDHIYKMDYQTMLDFHIEQNAGATISVIEVPWKDASRFGIMNTDENMQIKEFVEKPAEPESNLASMGVYIFDWKKLEKYLQLDNDNKNSSHDFGKDIIPLMLEQGEKMMAYPYKGYWKDVGTVESLWEANMDLLNSNSGLNLNDPAWRIFSSNPQLPPQVIGETGYLQEALINEGCVIDGKVEKSVIFQDVEVKEGASLYECVVMSCVVVGKGAKLSRVIIEPNLEIPENFELKEQNGEIVLLTQDIIDEWKGSAGI
ncbi:glucose-1-phosphate adenylyltransferase [Planococcus shenhongbingii]|uniref:Glucose-1-phosphate adenylyltransferase n=1 Tax=Planococcus shenhongbingii TaxID=3058398 RepID=A0ABT8NFW4_9BACL|nr:MULTISPECIES: glucose-1-phosphate adenylyltransferase [unclassified Planococcus (in: firmicutes)]MDN7246767.1 glucose-1-phosphate adenylyltransferase [Planococcus sp. N017]WKA58875.1 glucose-1-phosphate adenylyltransferase [Planococcus sp. N016]